MADPLPLQTDITDDVAALIGALQSARNLGPLPPGCQLIASALLCFGPDAGSASGEAVEALVGRRMEDVERELILHTLERCGGNRTSASVVLGISVRTMRNKLRAFHDAGYPVSPAP